MEDAFLKQQITESFGNCKAPFYTNIHQISKPYSLTVLVDKYNQLPKDYIPNDLEVIESSFNAGGLLLRHIARIAFENMCQSAEEADIHLEAISTFRSFEYQEQVYLKNKTPDITLEAYQLIRDKVSARAGHSEHQTGLAVDINDLEQTFEYTPEGIWLAENLYYAIQRVKKPLPDMITSPGIIVILAWNYPMRFIKAI